MLANVTAEIALSGTQRKWSGRPSSTSVRTPV